MRYTLEITVAAPRDRVVELFDNPDNLPHWQESLASLEFLSGIRGQVGAKSKLIHKFQNHKIEVIETVERRSLPDELVCIYEAKNAWNRVVYRFIEINKNKTMWVLMTEFRCTGFLRVLTFLMPSILKKASIYDMKEFKWFAESQPLNNLCKLYSVK